jgi:hypothetical protein
MIPPNQKSIAPAGIKNKLVIIFSLEKGESAWFFYLGASIEKMGLVKKSD